MNFSFAALFLASIAFPVQGLNPDALVARWQMDTPVHTYDPVTNLFTLNFPTASTDNVVGTGMEATFYAFNCQDDGTAGFDEYEIPSGILATDGTSATLTMNGPNDTPQLEFRIDTQILANDQRIYTEFDGDNDRKLASAPFTCSRQWIDDNDASNTANCNSPNVYSCSFNCPDTVEVGYYPDLTTKHSFCHCTGSTAPSTYQQCGPGTFFNSGNTNYLSQYTYSGYGHLYGKMGGYCDHTYNMDNANTDRPPWVEYPDTTSGGGGGGIPSPDEFDPPPFDDNDADNSGGGDSNQDSDGGGDGPSPDESDPPPSDGNDPDDSAGNCPAPGSGLGDRYGEMKMCVRTGLGYTTTSEFKEVNFIETQITIKYDLTAGFCVDAFAVQPKDRVQTNGSKEYGLEAWLCAPTDTEDLTNPDRTLPKKITSYEPDSVTGEKQADGDAFNQGSLITVCVAPDAATYEDGIVISALTDFEWSRTINVALGSVEQPAIENSSPSILTSYDPAACSGSEFCHFSSILNADFYISPGSVSGSGNANLEFATVVRRLGGIEDDKEGRQLQDASAPSPFDVSVTLATGDDGIGQLRTAGGASYGISVVASVVALASAALLA